MSVAFRQSVEELLLVMLQFVEHQECCMIALLIMVVFADRDSMLYEENGTLLQEIRQLTQLDQLLLNSIERAISGVQYDGDDFSMRDYGFSDWQNEPTERPNDVVYILVVYGVDTRRWEETARELRHQNSSRF